MASPPRLTLVSGSGASSGGGNFGTRGGGTGGGSGDGMDSREYTDHRINEVLTKIDASHQILAAEIKVVDAHIMGLPTKQWTILALLALFAAWIAVMAFGGDRFDSGLQVSGGVSERIGKVEQSVEDLNGKLDVLIARPPNAVSPGTGSGEP